MRMKEFLSKRKYYVFLSFLSFLSGVVFGYSLSGYSGIIVWVGSGVTLTGVAGIIMQTISEIRHHKSEERKKKEIIRKKLNEAVFKKWKNVSALSYGFYLEIRMEEQIDQHLLEIAKEWLEDESERTRKIWDLWNQLKGKEGLIDKYNELGEKVQRQIAKHLREAFPSLHEEESKSVEDQEDCYVIDSIIRFVETKLKVSFLKNGHIDWNDIRLKKYFDRNIKRWKLEGYPGLLVQSINSEDCDEAHFREVMENLIQSISSALRQLNKLEEEIDLKIRDFKKEMNQLTIDIEYTFT